MVAVLTYAPCFTNPNGCMYAPLHRSRKIRLMNGRGKPSLSKTVLHHMPTRVWHIYRNLWCFERNWYHKRWIVTLYKFSWQGKKKILHVGLSFFGRMRAYHFPGLTKCQNCKTIPLWKTCCTNWDYSNILLALLSSLSAITGPQSPPAWPLGLDGKIPLLKFLRLAPR